MTFGRRAIRWLRVVSPPAWTIVIALVLYLTAEGLHQHALSLEANDVSRRLGRASHFTVAWITAAYALFRGIAFHPASREEYLAWLALTPWRLPKPLPLGPVHVVAQDLVFLALFEILLLDASLDMRLLLPAIFLFVLIGCWALWVWMTGLRSAAYAIAFALGATVWASSSSYLAANVGLVVTYVFALRSLRRSFATFPWEPFSQRRKQFSQMWSRQRQAQGIAVQFTTWGWTFDVLNPQRSDLLPLGDCLILSGLAGWGAFAILSHALVEPVVYLVGMVSVCGCGLYCLRKVLRYIWSHAPPINFLGRLVTGRWVIPSYDIALIPIVYFFGTLYIAGYLVSPNVAWPVQYVLPTALTLYLLLMNLACPHLDKWRLTCKARLSPWVYAAAKGEYEQL